ncbi:MAG: tRNA pseudouridine(55) synthase TruB [Acidimicrobiia bacterium]
MARRDEGPDGVVVVDKPAGWTSHDVVARARRLLGTRRVGHAGTLDPDATGVLVLGVGRATRLLRFVDGGSKRYRGVVVLGSATTTLDAAGEVVGEWDMAAVTLDEVRAAAEGFVGAIEQVPPMVSAVQIGGRRLHELARAGIEVDRPARPVTVHSLEVGEPVGPGRFPIEVECSTGTYVRVLAADLGTALGGGAHLAELRRTAVGPFTLDDAVALDDLAPEGLRPPRALVDGLAVVEVDEGRALDVGHGKVLDATSLGARGDGPWAVVDAAGALLAVYEAHRPGTVKPAVVLAGG